MQKPVADGSDFDALARLSPARRSKMWVVQRLSKRCSMAPLGFYFAASTFVFPVDVGLSPIVGNRISASTSCGMDQRARKAVDERMLSMQFLQLQEGASIRIAWRSTKHPNKQTGLGS